MSRYNRFGASYSSLPTMYSGTVAADFGGQAAIEESLDHACDQIVDALPDQVFSLLLRPQLCRVVERASAGQVSVSLPIYPIVAGSLYLWTGQPEQFQDPIAGWPDDLTETDDYSVNATTGVVTLVTGLTADDQVFGTWKANQDAATFAADSLARLALRGAAAELGARLFSEATQEWKLVDAYRGVWTATLDAFRRGLKVPDELRRLSWWTPLERRQPGGLTIVRSFRA
jgi:hypothetical protein